MLGNIKNPTHDVPLKTHEWKCEAREKKSEEYEKKNDLEMCRKVSDARECVCLKLGEGKIGGKAKE